MTEDTVRFLTPVGRRRAAAGESPLFRLGILTFLRHIADSTAVVEDHFPDFAAVLAQLS